MIRELGDLCPFKLDDVKVLVPIKEWGMVCKDNTHFVDSSGKVVCKVGVDSELIEKEYEKWEREFIFEENAITYKELGKNQDKYVVSMNLWEIKHLIDIKPEDAIWIKSSCEPFCEEMELDEERKKNWLNHFGVKEYFAHASGHASENEIRWMVKEINPKRLIPVHTEHPNMFRTRRTK